MSQLMMALATKLRSAENTCSGPFKLSDEILDSHVSAEPTPSSISCSALQLLKSCQKKEIPFFPSLFPSFLSFSVFLLCLLNDKLFT